MKQLLTGIVMAATAGSAFAQTDNPWLLKMADALSSQTYTARLFHQQGEHIVSLLAVQASVDGQQLQLMQRLDGADDSAAIYATDTTCGLADGALGTIDPTLINPELYQVSTAGDVRVAGRDAARVQIIAKDPLRYSYLLDVDKATGLPLRYVIVGLNRVPLERIQLVSIDTSEALAQSVFVDSQPVKQQCDRTIEVDSSWGFAIPAGFNLRSGSVDQGRQRLTYSDGLASFTLYIESGAHAATLASRGALNAIVHGYNLNGTDYTLTLMGDLPKPTLERMIKSVRLVDDTSGH